MSARIEALKQVFKKGVKSVKEDALADLFKKTPAKEKLYRFQYETSPEHFMEQGWVRPENNLWTTPKDDPLGIYWAPTKKDLTTFMQVADPDSIRPKLKDYDRSIIEGIRRPDAKIGVANKEIDNFDALLEHPDVDFLERRYKVSTDANPDKLID